MEDVLVLKNISKSFPGVQALKDVDFELRKGEIHALVGENGAGKSTLVKIIAGVYQPDEGDIILEGRKVSFRDANDAMTSGISTVHQHLVVFPDLTVLENLFVDRYAHARGFISWDSMREEAQKVMNEFGINLPLDEEVRALSAPAQKLLQILRALLKDTKVLILDEPTAALTVDETDILFRNINKLRERGISVIYISHLLEEIFELADRVTVLRNGKVIVTSEMSNISLPEIIKAMIGKELEAFYPSREHNVGDVILEVKGLYRGILRDVSFSLREGEILGIAGILGSGRTTLAKVLFGILQPEAGSIKLEGKEINIETPVDAISSGIVYVPEDRQRQGLVLQENIKFNITLPNLEMISGKVVLNTEKEVTMTEECINKFNIEPPIPEFQVLHLSGGNQQKVVIAKWSVRNASVIIMDEPTQGIDVGTKSQIYELMNKFVEEGKGIILISSDFNELINMCDRIVAIRKGMILGEIRREDFSLDSVISLATQEVGNSSIAIS